MANTKNRDDDQQPEPAKKGDHHQAQGDQSKGEVPKGVAPGQGKGEAQPEAGQPEPTKGPPLSTAQLGAQALPPLTDMKGPGAGAKTDYGPRAGIHLAQQGECVLENWVGKVDGKRTRVARGTPIQDLHPSVKKALEAHKAPFGRITYEELGQREPGYSGGAKIVNVTEG